MGIKYFTKPLLLKAVKLGNKRNYNRQLNAGAIAKLGDSTLFPVVFSMLHEHIAGKLADPHIRAMVMVSEVERVMLDVDLNLFNSLPVAEV